MVEYVVKAGLALVVAGMLAIIIFYGMSAWLIPLAVVGVALVAALTYLDPALMQERRLQVKLREMDDRERAEDGTLGRAPEDKGFIELNFFNLFWIFVVCSMLGLAMETLYHFVQFHEYQDRAGLLFGPFSPIYGVGAVLMTLVLNRFYRTSVVPLFFMSALLGGAFEYFTSWFLQTAFGVTAWDYTGMWLSIGGRTCGLYMCIWGFLGVLWIKVLLPGLLRLVNLIPWNWRYAVTTVCAVLMAVNIVMSLQALDCWYLRESGAPVTTPVEHFYADHFDNQYMANRFQTMDMHPEQTARAG